MIEQLQQLKAEAKAPTGSAGGSSGGVQQGAPAGAAPPEDVYQADWVSLKLLTATLAAVAEKVAAGVAAGDVDEPDEDWIELSKTYTSLAEEHPFAKALDSVPLVSRGTGAGGVRGAWPAEARSAEG